MAMMSANVGDDMKIYASSNNNAYAWNAENKYTLTTGNVTSLKALSCWDYWHKDYYPNVIRESYPVYIKERAEDKGKQAFEIIKQLQDKRLMKLDKVSDFIDAMDCLIKIL